MIKGVLILCMCILPCVAWGDAFDLYKRTFTVAMVNSDKKLNIGMQLYDRLTLARERETSLENRLLGAAAIGLAGTGLSDMMAGDAQRRADEAAERDMRAYIETFRCDYGAGRNIRGGEKGVQIPTSAEFSGMVSEYKQLAGDLKLTKEALNMRPGIESETVFDSATTGLYDNVSVGIKSGAFTSVYRALTDENSQDAADWKSQVDASKKKTQDGKTTGTVGVVGGIAGNVAVNGNFEKSAN